MREYQPEKNPVGILSKPTAQDTLDADASLAMGQTPSAQTGHGTPAHAASVLQLQRQFGNRYVQRMLALARKGASEGEVAPEVESSIERARGAGQQLEHGARQQMENAFGADFGGVRVHTGEQAHALNRAVNAVAFTTGRDIFFRDGAYNPQTPGGKELLAHELTHVVQQGGAPAVQAKLVVGAPDDVYEREAEQVAKSVVNAADVATVAQGASAVQRRCACGAQSSGEECEACATKHQVSASAQTSSSGGARGEVQRAPATATDSAKDTAEFQTAADQPANPDGRGAQKRAAVDRAEWQEYFQQALQGVSGKTDIKTPKDKAAKAAAIADECMDISADHGCRVVAAMASVPDQDSKTQLNVALASSNTPLEHIVQKCTAIDFRRRLEVAA